MQRSLPWLASLLIGLLALQSVTAQEPRSPVPLSPPSGPIAVPPPNCDPDIQPIREGPPSPTADNSSAKSNNTADWLWSLLAETPPPMPHSGGLPMMMMSPSITADYRITYVPDAPVRNQPAQLNDLREELTVGIPVWKSGGDMMAFTLGVRNEILNTGAVLPTPPPPFPNELWDIRFGVSYKHDFDNGWTTGVTVNVGSASDRPFAGIDEMTASFAGFLRIPVGDHNAWIFSLAYSPTAELNFPIPGVAFYWQPSDTFNAMIGIPFKIWWRPVEDLTLDVMYMPLTNGSAKATWHLWGGVFLYASYNIENEAYLLYDRENYNDRFFYYDQRLTGGVKCEFGRHCTLDLSGGYLFDRYYFEGATLSDSHNDRVDIGNSPFASVLLHFRF